MASVRNHSTVVRGHDARAEAAALRSRLGAARADLARLEAEGHGEHFGDGAEKTEVAGFKENARRKAAYDAEALVFRSRLTEVKGGGGGTAADAAALRARAERAEAESANLRDILMRQRTIKGFYIPPKPGYEKRLAEVRELEARLGMCSVCDDDGD